MSTDAVKGLAQTLNGIGLAEKVRVAPFFQTRTLPDTLDWATRAELKFWGWTGSYAKVRLYPHNYLPEVGTP